jgi:hypothetical protein
MSALISEKLFFKSICNEIISFIEFNKSSKREKNARVVKNGLILPQEVTSLFGYFLGSKENQCKESKYTQIDRYWLSN